ncbi:DNA mismatch repair protein MutS [Clostridium gasigenes]|uniref:MutS-related protein n=1 Tax=Clostridium gasigenes TaxID=94869 RepID=UPI001438527E|nr:DNA mismatch repair protein MutS [Clostridium gasigenes]MBU3134111.1 DNA mismatch repair protein MutS [Clostridium gasigenes]NKF07965.1 DNA mismatch repair protein MutS [Clostridium gasigenes]QSW20657.1 DNA mismatch repair protein MutS [Clostridium gasigenes]
MNKDTKLFYKLLTYLISLLCAFDIYISYKLYTLYSAIFLQVGIVILVALIIIAFKSYSKFKLFSDMDYLKSRWPHTYDNTVDLNKVDKLYKEYGPEFLKEKNFSNIDDQTASDLNIDDIFESINICTSSPGEQMLYYILRTPKLNKEELISRNNILEFLSSNNDIRSELQVIITGIGKQYKGDIFNLFNTKKVVSKSAKLTFNILGSIGLISLVSIVFIGIKGLLFILPLFLVYQFIHNKSSTEIEDEVTSIGYLGTLISSAKKLSKIKCEELSDELSELKTLLEPVKNIDKKTFFVADNDAADAVLEYIKIILLAKIRCYYSLVDTIKDNREALIKIYSLVGKIDAYISIASYRERLDDYTYPNFIDRDKYLKLNDALHPLILDGVPNSIELNKRGIVLTGSNMSGKSTFMRTIGTNILLSQTIYTSLCSEYTGSFFRILSSLSIADDVTQGKSYYLGECNSLLRILNSIEEEIPSFCIIDEIFKGTNPLERIASSKEILRYIMDRNALAIVATHDLELAETCNNNYLCYYFCEDVDKTQGLTFDFKLKEGICHSGNALKLLDFLGYPKEIIDNALNSIHIGNK